MKRKITLEQAIKLLEQKHADATKNPSVFDPVAYALYHTWREEDETNRRARDENRKPF